MATAHTILPTRARLDPPDAPDDPPPPPPPLHRLSGVDVTWISLAGQGKNGRTILAKGERPAAGRVVIEKAIRIQKADAPKKMVYGVVYAPDSPDSDGHVMDAVEIEKALHSYMAKGRVANVDVNHNEEGGIAYVAESWLTKSNDSGAVVDPLFPDEPAGTWVVGIKVTDDGAWRAVEKGEITGLSFAGVGQLCALEEREAERFGAAAFAKATPPDFAGTDAAESLARRLLNKAKDLLTGEEGAERPAATALQTCDACGSTPVRRTPRALEKRNDGPRDGKSQDPHHHPPPKPPIGAPWNPDECDEMGCRMTDPEGREWLLTPVAKSEYATSASADARIAAVVEKVLAPHVAPLCDRLDALEGATAGRQTLLGGLDVTVEKAETKGLTIF